MTFGMSNVLGPCECRSCMSMSTDTHVTPVDALQARRQECSVSADHQTWGFAAESIATFVKGC